MSIYKKTVEYISKPEVRFLFQVPISEEEYKELIDYTRVKIKNLYMATIPNADPTIAVSLVQIALRRYSEGNYWDYFLEELNMDVSVQKRNYLGQIFAKTLQVYNLFEIPRDKNDKYAYVENIKAHALVPNNYLTGYFDFLFSFYDRNLLRQINYDLLDDIADLLDYLASSSVCTDDEIKLESIGDGAKKVKSYKLLKATKIALSKGSLKIVGDVLSKHLKMIDDYYYDNVIPTIEDRFSDFFNCWINQKESEINWDLMPKRQRTAHTAFYRKPHFDIDRDYQQAFLVLPEQKIRDEDFSGSVYAKVTCCGNEETIKLALYKAYGIIVLEPRRIPIPDLFSEITVDIVSGTTKHFEIAASEYRIFDDQFNEISKLKKGHNYVLTKNKSSVSSELDPVYINRDILGWDEYSYNNVTEETVIYINGKPISIVGEFSDKPLFEYVSKEYLLYWQDSQLQTAFRHPVVSFRLRRSLISKALIWCNNEKFTVNSVATSFVPLTGDDDVGVSIFLEDILDDAEGQYFIYLDAPQTPRKLLCKYVLIRELRCRPEKSRFIFTDIASIYIYGGYDIEPVNCVEISEGEYCLDLNEDIEQAKFNLKLDGVTYTLCVPIKLFQFGFDKKWEFTRKNYIWYTELKNNLYIKMPGATLARVYANKDEKSYVLGELTDTEEFRFDISQLVQSINESPSSFGYINLQYYDNKWRKLPLFRVLKRVWVYELDLEFCDGEICLDAEFIGDNALRVRFLDEASGNMVAEKDIMSGRTVFSELSPEGLYTLERYEVEADEFGFSENLIPIGEPLHKIGVVNYNDLSNCRMQINKIIISGQPKQMEYIYRIYDLRKIDEFTYQGRMTAQKRSSKDQRYSKSTDFAYVQIGTIYESGRVWVMSIQEYKDDECNWLYFDAQQKCLLSGNDDLLYSSKDIARFLPLYDEVADYEVGFRRVK